MDNTSIHPLSRDLEHLIDLLVFKGRPQNRDPAREVVCLVNHGYVVGFSPSWLQPAWAAYRVAWSDRDVDYDRPHLYYEDTRLAEDWRIGPETFGSLGGVGYHVGHMVPNEVINRQFGRLAQMETFFMSNMSPQRGSLNTGVWLTLENSIRKIEDTPDRDHVWAVTGPIFPDDPQEIARPNGKTVPVPEAYFCVTVDPFRYPWDLERNVDVACFRIPQDAAGGTPLSEFEVELEAVEAATQLSFFPAWSVAGVDFRSRVPGTEPRARHRLLRQLY